MRPKDSLGAAEDIEAIFDQDPQRVCILQGPVAARGSIVKDEPVKEVLGNINNSLIERLLKLKYNNDKTSIPTVDYLGVRPSEAPVDLDGVRRTESTAQVTYEIANVVPETASWLEFLAGAKLNWMHALITAPMIVQGSLFTDTPIRRLLAPRAGQKIIVTTSGNSPSSVTVYGAARSYGRHKSSFKSVEINYDSRSKLIDLTLYEDRCDVSIPLSLQFEYKPSSGYAPVHEVVAGRNTRIKEFYWKLWYGDDALLPAIDVHENFIGPEVTIEAGAVEQFCAVVGNQGKSFKSVWNETVRAPMDFAIVTGWKVCCCFTPLLGATNR